MSRLFYHVAQDSAGNLLFGVTGTMRIANTGTLATIYGDEGMTVVLPNPMTNHPSFGSFKCYLDVGDYDFYLAKGGYTFETLTGVQGYGTMAAQDADAVGITGGSLTGIVALGIGTSAPTVPLHVQGSALINGPVGVESVPDDLYSLTVGADSYFVGNMGIGGAPSANFDLLVTGQTLLAGNVAIGDATLPVSHNLRVTGLTFLDGQVGIQAVPNGLYSLTVGADSYFVGNMGIGSAPNASLDLVVAGQTVLVGNVAIGDATLPITENLRIGGTMRASLMGLGRAPDAAARAMIDYPKGSGQHGVQLTQIGSDTGLGQPMTFLNASGVLVGSVSTTASNTAFNTTSDGRLKHAIEALPGALTVLKALNPVRFRWRADNSEGAGFVAQEVAQVLPAVVAGRPDDVDEAGRMVPMGMDHSKLVVYLVGAVKELTQQVEALTARLDAADV